MIIEFVHITGKDPWEDRHDEFIIKVNGKNFMHFSSYGEPEDNSIGRDWSDVFKIPDLLAKVISVYDNRSSMENVDIVHTELTWQDYYSKEGHHD